MSTLTMVEMPNGKTLNLTRPRSDGPLDAEELAYCRQHDIPLAYDPTAYGWVCASCEDDLALTVQASSSGRASTPPQISGELRAETWFNQSLEGLLGRWHARRGSVQQLGEEMWQLPGSAIERAQSYEPLSTADQLRLFCRFQQQVASRLHRAELAEGLSAEKTDEVGSLEQKYSFRPWRAVDVNQYVELLDNPKVWQYLDESYPNPLTKVDALKLIELSSAAAMHEVRAVVCDGSIVGQIRLQFEGSSVSPGLATQDAEINYWLGEAYWGRGMMTEILRLYTRQCFQQHPLSSLSAWVHERNTGSIKVLEKAGYRYVGDAMSRLSRGAGFLVFRAFKFQPTTHGDGGQVASSVDRKGVQDVERQTRAVGVN